MPQIQQTTIADIVARLPQLVPWNVADVDGSIALLIVCAGFEDRAVAIVEAVGDATVEHLLVVDYPTNQIDNARALARLDAVKASSRSILRYDRSTFFSDVSREVENWKSSDPIVIDISAMASYVSARLLKAVWDRCESSVTRVFYAEAVKYHPTVEDWTAFFSNVPDPSDNLSIAASYEETYFQSRGVEETYECDAFPGRNEGPLATELIVTPSFSLQRVKSTISFAENRYNVGSGALHWFLGSPPDKTKNGWRFDAIARLYNVQSGGIAVDTRDYRDILRKLEDTWNEALKNERHLVVGGMGSKMQNVGVFMFLAMHPECGLLHCEPKEFIASRYSEGVGPTWCLDLGRIGELKRLLISRGKLAFKW